MKSNHSALLTAIGGCLLLAGMVAAVFLSGRAAFASREAEHQVADILSINETPGNMVDAALYKGSFGLIGEEHKVRTEKLEALQERAEKQEATAGLFAAGAFAAGAGYILRPLPRTAGSERRPCLRVRRLVPPAAIALIAGVALPMLSSVTTLDIPVAGEVVFKAQSKSILGTIGYLAGTDLFLAGLIALFSVVTPATKLVLLALLTRQTENRTLHAWIERVGRWAMTDVFVVALLLTFLALGTRDQNAASIEIGFYYFLAAAILPILALEILSKENH
ncbi:MAG: paraquat-inducible protein A [Opitutales bacterium]